MLGHGCKAETLYSGTESGTGTSLHTILASAQELYPQTPAPSSYFTHKSLLFSFNLQAIERQVVVKMLAKFSLSSSYLPCYNFLMWKNIIKKVQTAYNMLIFCTFKKCMCLRYIMKYAKV